MSDWQWAIGKNIYFNLPTKNCLLPTSSRGQWSKNINSHATKYNIPTLNFIKQTENHHMHLVDRVKQRDQKAYKELYDLYAKPMYNLCFRFLNHHDDAHDVLQESFIKIFENIGQLNNKGLLSAWIKRICTNTAIQALKNKKRLKFDELDDQPMMINLHDEEDIIHEEEYESNIQLIHQAIQLLPDRYRVVFTMHVMEDYSHEEISKMLGIVSGTSRSQYLRAKQKLIEIIKKNKHHVRQVEKIHSAV